MADLEESQPFLAGNEAPQGEEGDGEVKETLLAANRHFKRAVNGISIAMSAISGLTVIIIFGIFISIEVSPVSYTGSTTDTLLDIGTCILIAFALTTLNCFIQLPILINIICDLTLSILILNYTTIVFRNGWPHQYQWCPSRDRYYDPNVPASPPDPGCLRFLFASKILIGVSAGLSYIIGLMFLALLILRFIALVRTKFWERATGISPGEYNYQLTFTISRKGDVGGAANATTRGSSVQSRMGESEGQLIET